EISRVSTKTVQRTLKWAVDRGHITLGPWSQHTLKLGIATYYQKPAFFLLRVVSVITPWGEEGCVVASLGRWAGSPRRVGAEVPLGHDAPADRVVTSPGPSRAL